MNSELLSAFQTEVFLLFIASPYIELLNKLKTNYNTILFAKLFKILKNDNQLHYFGRIISSR